MANENDPEVIRQRMLENRTALTEKLEALEQQVLGVASSVTGTVESVKEGVQETVDAVRDSVTETVENVKETMQDTVSTVKDTFNLPLQVERHPWLMVAGSVGVGLLLGAFLRRRTVSNVGRLAGGVVRRFRGAREEVPQAREEPHDGNGARKEEPEGVTDHLLGTVKEGIGRVKDLALGTLFGTVEKLLVQELPQTVEGYVKNFLDEASNKLKSGFTAPPAPTAETAVPPAPAPQARMPTERSETAFHPQTGRPMRPGSW